MDTSSLVASYRVYFLTAGISLAVAIFHGYEASAWAAHLLCDEWGFRGPVIGWSDFWGMTGAYVVSPFLLSAALLIVGFHKLRAARSVGE